MSNLLEVSTMKSSFAVCLLALVALVVLADGSPVPGQDSSGSKPLIEFLNGGGFRVNFAGYHAEAGLGGLLTGSRQNGGLFARAGTPDGTNASAGLGGSLNGGPSGGLHAKAGLGNGGPSAGAGLSGTVNGPNPEGEIYAGNSLNGYKIKRRINRIKKLRRVSQQNE